MSESENKNRKGARIYFVVTLVFSLLLLGNGISGYYSLLAQKVAGFPNAAQVRLYIVFPFFLVVANGLLLAFLRKLPRALVIFSIPAYILSLIVLIFLGAGGI